MSALDVIKSHYFIGGDGGLQRRPREWFRSLDDIYRIRKVVVAKRA